MKIPLMTMLHFFDPSAGSRPGNAVWTNVALTFQSFAIALARSTSKPIGLPAAVFDSIGGNVGSLQYLNDPFTGDAASRLAPAVPTTARRAAATASSERTLTTRFIAPSSFGADLRRS